MRTFLGCVIRESLSDQAVLDGWTPVVRRVAEMPDDPDAKLWHVDWFQVEEAALRERLPALARAMRPHWYGHFFAGDDLCVILAGAFFWAKASDRSTWEPFIAHGDAVGVERRYTESVPTEPPAFVKEALRRPTDPASW